MYVNVFRVPEHENVARLLPFRCIGNPCVFFMECFQKNNSNFGTNAGVILPYEYAYDVPTIYNCVTTFPPVNRYLAFVRNAFESVTYF